MKKYRLVDYYEGYEIIGEYSSYNKMLTAAYEYTIDTDGECDLEYYEWCKYYNKYFKIIE